MCDCNAFELEADSGDLEGSWGSIEQSPAGVTWAHDWHFGDLGFFTEEGIFVPKVNIEFADSGFDLIRELVVIDEESVWVLGQSGIYQIPVEDLDLLGLSIHNGIGIVDSNPVGDYRFRPAASGVIDDFDIANGFVWWIEDRTVFSMGIGDFDGTPIEVFDVTDDFDAGPEPLLATSENRIWICITEQNPTFRAYEFDGTSIEFVTVESVGLSTPVDMTCERDTGVLVVASATSGS